MWEMFGMVLTTLSLIKCLEGIEPLAYRCSTYSICSSISKTQKQIIFTMHYAIFHYPKYDIENVQPLLVKIV